MATRRAKSAGITAEQAEHAITEERNRRVAACEAEIAEVLKKHKCGLLPVVTLTGGSAPQAEVRVVPVQ